MIHTGHGHRDPADQPELQGSGLAEVAELRNGHVHSYSSGQSFPLSECCPLEAPGFEMGLPGEIWRQAFEAQERREMQPEPLVPAIPVEVSELAAARQAARMSKDWAASDALRARIEALGWRVKDTPDGPVIEIIR